jgi:alkylhydroperoxidase/carboxymuconolactone decarboxylase family protein YurZ
VERREFLESGSLGLGGLAIASAMVASAPAEAAGGSTQTRAASATAEVAGESMQTKAIDTIRGWDPAKAEAYLKVNTNPWTNGVLDIKTIELICVGLNAACTNLQPEPTRRHIRAALQAGATRNEIQLVIEGAAFMAIHACSLGAPILLEEGKAAGKTPTVKKVATPSADVMKAKGLWNTAWDPFFGLDPLWTDQFFAAVGGIYDGKTLQPKFVELLSIALDASVTHMYAPGTRRYQGRLGPGCDHGRDHGDAEDRHVLRTRDDQHGDTDPG